MTLELEEEGNPITRRSPVGVQVRTPVLALGAEVLPIDRRELIGLKSSRRRRTGFASSATSETINVTPPACPIIGTATEP